MVSAKLQKILAEAGFGSRREMERWIAAGRVAVNGRTAQIGQRIEPQDRVQVDNRNLLRVAPSRSRILLMNKEAGVICSAKDPEGRTSSFDGLPVLQRGRWISVGRLDINTSGLLLFSNDGALANRMMHPSSGLDREYAVRVDRELTRSELDVLTQGIEFEDGLLKFTDIRYFNGSEKNHWYHVVVMEGRNREVRRLLEFQGLRISRLKRVRFGPVILPSRLKRGRFMELNDADVAGLYRLSRLDPSLPRSSRNTTRAKAPKQAMKSVLLPYPGLPDGTKSIGRKASDRKPGSGRKSQLRRS